MPLPYAPRHCRLAQNHRIPARCYGFARVAMPAKRFPAEVSSQAHGKRGHGTGIRHPRCWRNTGPAPTQVGRRTPRFATIFAFLHLALVRLSQF